MNASTAPNPVLSNLPIMIEQKKKVKNFDNSHMKGLWPHP